MSSHRRTGQHPFGGGRPGFARVDSVGEGGSSRIVCVIHTLWGGVAEIFRDTCSVGEGVVPPIFRQLPVRTRLGGGVVA